MGFGDVTYNPRRSILGAVSITAETAYHLWTVDANASKSEDIIKLNRKSKWHSEHGNFNDN